jgi:hypothetical protein
MVHILQRRGTAAAWTTANSLLGPGEIGFETDTKKIKIGDGTTLWASLSYFTAGGGSGTTLATTSWSGTTQTLTSAFQVWVFTGSAATTVTLPAIAGNTGVYFYIDNRGTASITINPSGTDHIFHHGSVATITVPPGGDWEGVNDGSFWNAISDVAVTDSQWWTHNAADASKTLQLSLSLLTTGTAQVLSTPNVATDTLVTLTSTGTLTSKTLTSPTLTTPTLSGTATGTYTLGGTPTLTGPSLTAGTAAVAPLKFASGTNLTTAAAGAVEYDGTVFYQTPAASTRSVIDGEQFCTLTSAYTLTSQTAAQKLFNTTTNGAVTLPVGSYFFECFFTLSALSTVTGGFGFALGGAATIAGQLWETMGSNAALATAASPQSTVNTAANTAIVTATTSGVGWAKVWGKVRISVAGTLIPQVSLVTAAAGVVGIDSSFRIWPVGSATVTTVGNWS